MLTSLDKSQVTILPSIFRERMDLNRQYLLELDSTCLLQNFYLEACIQVSNEHLHWGWEAPTCQLRGHFLGHWLSAAAALSSSDKDRTLKCKLDNIISELARCQELNGNGWVGPIPEKYFEMLTTDRYIWSPQYTMHKLIMGLTHAYQYAGSTQALEILDRLAGWYIRWTDDMQKRSPHAVYSGEEGGMLEIWTELYALTKNEIYKELAGRYQDAGLFRKLKSGQDPLTNCHANASIPLSHGAARLYEVTGDEEWRRITELFWDCAVTERGMLATTGQNAGEFWMPPHMQGQFLGERNQEFCTVYNMVRTAAYLYHWSGDTKYADYIERCLYNGFLAQQNPSTGMPTYFLPMLAGSKKKWGSKTRDFWCCHGTMVQAQTLYPDLIYYQDIPANRLVISQYIPSEANCRYGENTVFFTQDTDMKYYNAQALFDENDNSQMSRWSLKFTIKTDLPTALTLSFRLPCWIQDVPVLTIDGQPLSLPKLSGFTYEKLMKADVSGQSGNISFQVTDGYIHLTGVWAKTTICMYLPDGVVIEPLADMPELAAAVDGPIVLAGLTETDYGITGNAAQPQDFLSPQMEHTYSTFPWLQNSYRTRGQAKNFMLKPLYEIEDEAYTVYHTISTENCVKMK